MNEMVLNVEGMMCAGCEKRIENGLSILKGVKQVKANHEDGTVKIEYKKELNIDDIKAKITDIGYKVK